MTIQTLLDKVQDEKPNSFGEERLVAFINEIEAEVAEQLHVEVPIYTTDDMSEMLIAPSPYDRLYVSYVKAMIDYANEELSSYMNNQAQHVQDFRDFVDWVVRTKQVQDNRSMPARFRHVW